MISKILIIGLLFFINSLLGNSSIYLVNIGYESPRLIAPAMITIIPRDNHQLFQVGVVGWSMFLKGEIGFNKNLTIGLSNDISPKNSNASIYQYKNGELDASLNYENSTFMSQLYIKRKYENNLTGQINCILQKENINGLEEDILNYWDEPHFGYSVSGIYKDVEYEDFFSNHWDGKKVKVLFQFFPGDYSWMKGYIAGGFGKKYKQYQTNISCKYFFSNNLNIVNQFIVGGVWELELLDFLPGTHYGEYRIDEGLLINARFEKIFLKNMTLGYRIGILNYNDTFILGHGINFLKVYHGLVFNVGTSISNSAIKNYNLNKFIFSSGITFSFM